jgi:hypothetical protein
LQLLQAVLEVVDPFLGGHFVQSTAASVI